MLNCCLFSLLFVLCTVDIRAQQSDSISIHVQIIPITDSAALARCSKRFSEVGGQKGKVQPNKPIDCRISFETSTVDSAWISIAWETFDYVYYSSSQVGLRDLDTEENGTNLKGFIDTLKRSLIILENAEGAFRILYGRRGEYDRRLSKYEEMISCAGIYNQPTNSAGPRYGTLPPRNEYGDWVSPLIREKKSFYKYTDYQPFNRPNDLCGYPSVLFSFDDLRVKKGDTSCRMHYVYVSSTSNPKLERIRRVYTSNWFPLNEE